MSGPGSAPHLVESIRAGALTILATFHYGSPRNIEEPTCP